MASVTIPGTHRLLETSSRERHDSSKGEARRRRASRRDVILVSVIITMIVVEGFVAWSLVRPGESMLPPTAIILVLTAVPAAVGHFLVASSGGWRRRRVMAASLGVLCTLPVLWSYFGVLPASVSFDANAARIIQSAYRDAAEGCHVESSGSVGFLQAPFQVCVTTNGADSVVEFTTLDHQRGYGYVRGPSNADWFPDECVVHFFGPWWTFYDNNLTVSCPLGYAGQGGG